MVYRDCRRCCRCCRCRLYHRRHLHRRHRRILGNILFWLRVKSNRAIDAYTVAHELKL